MSDMINLSGLRHRYRQRTVLNIPSLAIQSGKITTILGVSGAGKSTLLRLMALLEAPTEGRLTLTLDGQPCDFNTADLHHHRQIAMVFQRPVLLSRSVQDNVAYGLHLRGEKGITPPVRELIDRIGLTDLASASAQKLSGGEVQRVALARALVLNPQLLLLDEPTTNLDPANGNLIEQLIHQQVERHGTTVVLVTHNVFQARRLSNHAALLYNGEIIETGPAETFFTHPVDPRTKAFLNGEMTY